MTRETILLAEDDSDVRSYFEMALNVQGFKVIAVRDGEEAADVVHKNEEPISLVLLDLFMPRKDGFEVLRDIQATAPGLPVIVVSGASEPLNVVEAMRLGAANFLGKPVDHGELSRAIRNALEQSHADSGFGLGKPPGPALKTFFGSNPEVQNIRALLPQIGASDVPVLIQGETGAGKEVLARELHAQSPRASKPFIKLNCAALPPELVESELFGYERGAFTGAFQRKAGLFELADGGTVMLDEIGDMELRLQAKLLHVLQDGEFQRIGGKETIRTDVRVISSTHRDLEEGITLKTFREDLYYRLNVFNLHIPPLRERKEDIIPLAEFFLAKHGRPGLKPPSIPPSLKNALLLHSWPGNIRELENIIRKFLVLRDSDRIIRELRSKSKCALPVAQAPSPVCEAEALPAPEAPKVRILEKVAKAKQEAEVEAILAVLNTTCWNRKQAAALLNIDYKALLYKMKKLTIEEKATAAASGRPA